MAVAAAAHLGRRRAALEIRCDIVRDEAAQLGVAGAIEPTSLPEQLCQRESNIEPVPRPRQRHVEQTPFLFKLLGVAGGLMGRDCAVASLDDIHRPPLQALGTVHGAEHQAVIALRQLFRESFSTTLGDREPIRPGMWRDPGTGRPRAPVALGPAGVRPHCRTSARPAARRTYGRGGFARGHHRTPAPPGH